MIWFHEDDIWGAAGSSVPMTFPRPSAGPAATRTPSRTGLATRQDTDEAAPSRRWRNPGQPDDGLPLS